MIRKQFRVGGMLLAAASLLFGQQVGTITGSGPFQLGRTHVPATAARSLPLLSCQVIRSWDSTLVLLLGASRIRVDRHSRVLVELKGTELWVLLAEGGIDFTLVPGSHIHLVALGKLIETDENAEGSITIQGPDKVLAVPRAGNVKVIEDKVYSPECREEGAAAWIGQHKVIVLIGLAGAAGTAIGIAVTRPSEVPVSQSKP
jgi:hypothetical protein